MDLKKAEEYLISRKIKICADAGLKYETPAIEDEALKALKKTVCQEYINYLNEKYNPLRVALESQGVVCRTETSIEYVQEDSPYYPTQYMPSRYIVKYTFFAKYKEYKETELHYHHNDQKEIEEALMVKPTKMSWVKTIPLFSNIENDRNF